MSELKIKISGIYLIKIGERFYIGSSRNIERRINEHKRKLVKNCHENQRLQRSFNKYGEFSWLVLEECKEQDLLKIEQSYLSLVEKDPRVLNCNFIANKPPSPLGRKMSDASKLKLSEARKGNVIITEKQRQFQKQMLTGNTYRKGSTHTKEAREKISQSHKGKTASEEARLKMSQSHLHKNTKRIIQLKDGVVLKQWVSASEAARVLGFNQSLISTCCRNERKTHKGFEWRFELCQN